MNRTRAALLEGARRSVEVNGTKITMAQVAAAAGVAKATLYNHFRTREAVLAALLADEVTRLVDECAAQPLGEALAGAANAVASHPLLRVLARWNRRPSPPWAASIRPPTAGARPARCRDRLAAASRGGTDTVLRWLASYLLTPAGPASVAADLAVVLAACPKCPVRRAPRQLAAHRLRRGRPERRRRQLRDF